MNKNDEPSTKRVFDGIEVDLKSPAKAAFLAFLFPGAGHFYQGRKHKAILFAICILGLFITGFIIGRGRVVYGYPNTFNPINLVRLLSKNGRAQIAESSSGDFRIHSYAQALVGIPAFPMILQSRIGPKPVDQQFLWGFMAPPPLGDPQDGNPDWLSKWNNEDSASFDLGSLYTAVAGLLNLLVIFDAYAGPMPVPVGQSKKKTA
jgi:TM2 domain-containing membrane protein YozV